MEKAYEILGVEKTISKEDLKKHFMKLQLKYHPDRKTGNKELYYKIVEAYKIVGSEKENICDLIDDFKKKYVGSEEEITDLIKLYRKHYGDMKEILDNHICCEDEDEPRLRKIFDDLIEKKILKKYKIYEKYVYNEPKRVKKRNKEKKKAEKLDLSKMYELFAQNEKKRKDALQQLEDKYKLQLVEKKKQKFEKRKK